MTAFTLPPRDPRSFSLPSACWHPSERYYTFLQEEFEPFFFNLFWGILQFLFLFSLADRAFNYSEQFFVWLQVSPPSCGISLVQTIFLSLVSRPLWWNGYYTWLAHLGSALLSKVMASPLLWKVKWLPSSVGFLHPAFAGNLFQPQEQERYQGPAHLVTLACTDSQSPSSLKGKDFCWPRCFPRYSALWGPTSGLSHGVLPCSQPIVGKLHQCSPGPRWTQNWSRCKETYAPGGCEVVGEKGLYAGHHFPRVPCLLWIKIWKGKGFIDDNYFIDASLSFDILTGLKPREAEEEFSYSMAILGMCSPNCLSVQLWEVFLRLTEWPLPPDQSLTHTTLGFSLLHRTRNQASNFSLY